MCSGQLPAVLVTAVPIRGPRLSEATKQLRVHSRRLMLGFYPLVGAARWQMLAVSPCQWVSHQGVTPVQLTFSSEVPTTASVISKQTVLTLYTV
jgi:hypothetical protein